MNHNRLFGMFAFVVSSMAMSVTLVGCNQEKGKSYGSAQGDLAELPPHAYEKKLIEVRSDRTGDKTFEFRLAVEADGHITAVQYLGGPNGPQIYSIDQLESGIVLSQVSKEVGGVVFTKDIVRIQALKGFRADEGGSVELDLLREYTINPFSEDDRRQLRFEISYTGGARGEWQARRLGSDGWQQFDALYFAQRKVGGEAKGIEAVEFGAGGETLTGVSTGDLKQN